jgi:ribose transport system permease protein
LVGFAAGSGRRRRAKLPQAAKALIATALLLILGAVVAPSSLSAGAILTMLPFVATLAVASLGQHLVILQRGVDLSVAGLMSLAAVICSAFPSLDAGPWETLGYVAVALLVGMIVGVFNGVVVTIVRVPALVTTIGVNALLLGATMFASRGFAQQVPLPLSRFGVGTFLGVPNTIYVMLAFGLLAIFIISRTTVGRCFVATSVNPAAAVAVGVPIERYSIAVYVASGVCYATAGILLASYLVSPTVFSGNPYLLATIAAVVIGGNSIGGGVRGSVVSTMIGAFFLTYLGQLVLSVGLGTWAQDIVQAAIVVCSSALSAVANNFSSSRRVETDIAAVPAISDAP